MVTSSLRIALALVGCLSLVGCAAEATKRDETPIDDGTVATLPASHAKTSDSNDEDETLPVTPVKDDSTTAADRLPPAQGGDAAETPPKGTTPPATGGTPTATEKTQTCTAVNGDNKSLTTVVYTVVDGTAKISKLTILVTNKDDRDQNDVDVFTQPAGGSEAKAFNSGDILVHDKAVAVSQASTLSVKTGAKLRFETNFDRQFLTDPSASCTIQF